MQQEEGDDTLADSIRAEKGSGEGEEGEEQEGAEGTESEEGEEGQEAAEGSESEGSEEGEEGEEGREAAGPDDPDEEEEGEEDPEPRGKRGGRGSERIQRQAAEINRLRAENDVLRRGGGGGGGNGGGAPAPQGVDPVKIRQGLKEQIAKDMEGFEFLSPADRAEKLLTSQERVLRTILPGIVGGVHESNDRTAFREKYGSHPLMKRFASEVENRVAQAKANGVMFPGMREQIFVGLVGESTLRGSAGGKKQLRDRDIRRGKAAGVSTKGKGDQGGTGGRKSTVQQLEERLKDRPI